MIILDMKKPASCETCPLHWNEQGMMCCGVTHDVVRENCPIKAEISDNATVCDIEQIRADIEQVKAIMNEEIIERDRKDLINFVNGINQCLLIIEQHISGKMRTISERR